jgi:TRAP-type C4-dicarboxylate transport system permease small subunit
MHALQGFNEFMLKIGSWGTILFMAVIAIVIPYEVIGRYVFASMSTWSGEVSTYSLAWASMLGGAVGLKKGYQVKMDSVVESVPPGAAKALKFLAYACSLFFFGMMFGFGLFQTIYNWQQTSPAIGHHELPYASLPAGFFIMFSDAGGVSGIPRFGIERPHDHRFRFLHRALVHLRAHHRGLGARPGLCLISSNVYHHLIQTTFGGLATFRCAIPLFMLAATS